MVDNASADGSAEMVAAEFPQARLVASRENLGFAGGNNLALRELGFGAEERGAGSTEERTEQRSGGADSSRTRNTHYGIRTTHHAPISSSC